MTALFPIMSDKNALGIGHSMWVFAAVNAVLFVLARWLVPETKGRSLEEIELELRGRHRVQSAAAGEVGKVSEV